MSDTVPFTDNYHDLSNDNGFQFEFFCERCGNGYKSPFDMSAVGLGTSVMKAASRIFGGRFSGAGSAGDELNRMTNSAGKDKAFVKAIEAVGENFEQCHGCGNWYCKAVCWNEETGQCVNCTPKLAQEVTRFQSEAQLEQVQQKVQEVDWTEDVNVHERNPAKCPHCGEDTLGGKFCPSCGADLRPLAPCPKCGTTPPAGTKFCPECGQPVVV